MSHYHAIAWIDHQEAHVLHFTRQLRAVDAALDRLHEPEFGLCEDCGGEVPYARLDANPAATRCVACQKQSEKT